MIILLGMPRSGTTWVGKIFDSHPLTFYCHEPDTSERLGLPLFPANGEWHAHFPEITTFARRLNRPLPMRVVGKLPLFSKHYRSALGNPLYRAAIWLSKLTERAGVKVTLPGVPSDANAIRVWKSIESLGRAGLIANALPDAQVVLLIRHPCAYIASVLRGEQAHKFTGNDAQSEDYGVLELLLQTELAHSRQLTRSQLEAASAEERLAWRWLLVNEKAVAETRHLANCQVLVYESLCAAPDDVGRQLLESCGLPWDPQCAAFLGNSTSQADDSYYAVFKDPLKAANRWRDELDAEVVARVRAVVAGTEVGRLYFD